MKLNERPAKPYMTGSEFPPAQLGSPFTPQVGVGVVEGTVPDALEPGGGDGEGTVPDALAPGGGDGEPLEDGELEPCTGIAT